MTGNMLILRCASGLLFLIGCVFALLAWGLVPAPLGILMPEYHYTFRDSMLSISGSLLAMVGYFIWIGWMHFAWRGRLPWMSAEPFMVLALANHLGWLIFFPLMRGESPLEFSRDLPGAVVFAWLILNATIAFIAVVYLRLECETESTLGNDPILARSAS